MQGFKPYYSVFLVWFSAIGVVAVDTILVVRPSHPHFETATTGLLQELGGRFRAVTFVIHRNTSVYEFEKVFQRTDPKLVVLMEGKSVKLFTQYQNRMGRDAPMPPSVALMTIYVGERIAGLRNATGIAYEIQGITSLVHLRSLVQGPVNRVGVLFSSRLRSFYEQQRKLCLTEQIELVGLEIDVKQKHRGRLIRSALRELTQHKDIDALWVINDNLILNNRYLDRSWRPALEGFKKPVVVGVEGLINDKNMGHFAVVPDHYQLGIQAGQMIYEIKENGWSAEGLAVRAPIGVRKYLNRSNLDPSIVIMEEGLLEWDHVIQ